MNRLNHIEAQRILGVLDDVLEKLQLCFLTSVEIPPGVDLQDIVGEQIAEALNETKSLEGRYHELVEQRKSLSNISDDEDAKAFEDLQTDLKETSKMLKEGTRHVVRLLKDNPDAMQRLEELQGAKTSAMTLMTRSMVDLKNITFERLKETVEESKRTLALHKRRAEDAKQANQDIKRLNKDLTEVKTDRQREIDVRNEAMAKLKEEIQQITARTEEERSRLTQTASSKDDTEHKVFVEKTNQLRNQISKLEEKLGEIRKANREEETKLRKKTHAVEQDIERWIERYDTEMQEKQNEIETLESIYAGEKSQLKEIQEKYKQVQEQRQKIRAQEDAVRNEARARASTELRFTNAARIIQRAFRAYKERKREERRKKKKGKKGNKTRNASPSRSMSRRNTRMTTGASRRSQQPSRGV